MSAGGCSPSLHLIVPGNYCFTGMYKLFTPEPTIYLEDLACKPALKDAEMIVSVSQSRVKADQLLLPSSTANCLYSQRFASSTPSHPSSTAQQTPPAVEGAWQHDLFKQTLQAESLIARLDAGKGKKDLLTGSTRGSPSAAGGTGMRGFGSGGGRELLGLPKTFSPSTSTPRELLGGRSTSSPAGSIGPDRRPRLALNGSPAASSGRTRALYPTSASSASLYPPTPASASVPSPPVTKRTHTGTPVELIASGGSYNGPRAPPVPAATPTPTSAAASTSMDVDMDSPSGSGPVALGIEQDLAKWGLKRGQTKVIVEGLVLGTTDEDVWVSAG